MQTTHVLILLAAYSIGVFAAAFVGGYISTKGMMTHTRTQVVISLVAGFILGIAMFHLLPHALDLIPEPHAVEKAVSSLVVGIVVMIFLLHVFHFHQHDFSAEVDDLYDHHHSHETVHVKDHSLKGVAIGLGLHTVTEGAALGLTVQAVFGEQAGAGLLPGLGVFLAIVLHKPLDAYSILSMMRAANYSNLYCTLVNFAFALLCPVVVFLTFFMTGGVHDWQDQSMVGYILAFAAGAFLCISLSDLLPEIQFHTHDRSKLTASLLLGLCFAFVLFYIDTIVMH